MTDTTASMPMKENIQKLINSSAFNNSIMVVIILNCILIGVETWHTSPAISMVQNIILAIYVIEIALRWIGRKDLKTYFSDGWNYFDVLVVAISFAPTTGPMAALRVLRVLRIFRTLRAVPELQLISKVLLKSLISLFYTGIFFFIFLYVYAVAGVSLFRAENYEGSAYQAINGGNPDPYGTLGESFFTLFRIMTGEDWTDLRYNLLEVTEYSNLVVTSFHVSWMIVAAFLLINLVIGAVINNYDQIMNEQKEEKEKTN